MQQNLKKKVVEVMQFALQYGRWKAYTSKQNDKRNRGFDDTSLCPICYL